MYFLLKTKSYTTDVKGKLFMKRTSLYLCSPYLNTCKEFNIFRRFACLLLITVVWIQWGFIALGKVILVWNHSQHFVLSFLMMLTLFLWPALFRVDHWKLLCFFFFPVGRHQYQVRHTTSTCCSISWGLLSKPTTSFQKSIFAPLVGTGRCVFSLVGRWFYRARCLPKRSRVGFVLFIVSALTS